ncbi:MAG: EamA family transporter [Acidobacteria bacterium]|nr:EamA family transporter [Acidobacteriota bacterium]MCG3191184.1 putative inner membrane transporter YedA [Thermoanaerobaculia bacterium]
MPRALASEKVKLILAFLAVYIVWGSTYLAIRIVLESYPPFLMAGARFLFSGTILLLMARAAGPWRPSGQELRSAALLGFLLLLCGNGGVVWAEERISSGLAALVVATEPLIVAGFNGALNRRFPPARTLVAMALGTLGLVTLINPAGSLSGETLGILAVVFAAAAWAIGSVSATRMKLPSSALASTGWQMLAGGVFLMIAGGLHGDFAAFDPARVTLRSTLAWLYLVVFGSLIGFTSYTYLLKRAAPEKVATYAWVNPLVAVLLGAALGGETLTLRTLLAGGIILVAVLLATLPEGSGWRTSGGWRAAWFNRARTAPECQDCSPKRLDPA